MWALVDRRLKSLGSYFGGAKETLPKVDVTDDETFFLRQLFVPQFYARAAGLPSDQPTETLFEHFLSEGLPAGIAPSPLFEPAVFREREGQPDSRWKDSPDLLRWYRGRQQSGIVPTTRFDPVFYLETYKEISEADIDPFEHFVRFGLGEGRRPNGIFDPEFYKLTAPVRADEATLACYAHYLVFGVERGAAPAAALVPLLARTRVDACNALAVYDRLIELITPLTHAIGHSATTLLLGLFHPYLYDGGGTLNETASSLERLAHFLEIGIDEGFDPGPLFDREHYLTVAELPVSRWTKPSAALWHFLDEGAYRQIVPTRLFDAAAYAAAWADMRDASIWGFGHFISAGIFEGRRIDGSERVDVWTLPLDSAEGQAHNWQLFWDEAGYPSPKEAEPGPAASEATGEVDAHPLHTDLSVAELALVKALFVAPWYARQARLPASTPAVELLAHYLAVGIDENLSPGPLFDPTMAARLAGAGSTASSMRHWLRGRQNNWAAPTIYFDKDFYKKFYKEFRTSSIDLYEHFITHGLHEKRCPNVLFDAAWYDKAYLKEEHEAAFPAYIHYLVYGADRGLAPSRLLIYAFGGHGSRSETNLSDYQKLVLAVRQLENILSPDQIQAMFAFFVPTADINEIDSSVRLISIGKLINFISHDIYKDISPGPFFDSEYYIESRSGKRILLNRKESPFLHYLRHGWSKRFVPNRIFDEEAYRSAQPDIAASDVWGFRHFIHHGVFEGRKIGAVPSLAVFSRSGELASSQMANWQLFWAGLGVMMPSQHLPTALLSQQKRLGEAFLSASFAEIVSRAQALEPAVGEPRRIGAIYAAPFHDQLADVMNMLRNRLPRRHYETVITVPWLRTGGADLVACQLAAAIGTARPGGPVLIVRVDQPNLERPDWIPDGVDQADLSDLLNSVSADHAEALLYALLLGLRPRRVVNVNSYRAWRMLERFGDRLRGQMALYSYLFCWDQSPEGLRVGYPSMFYAVTSPRLTATLTDTDYLRDELVRMYRPPADIARRTVALYTPSRTAQTKPPAAEAALSGGMRKRPKVLWAGRLDRQKRFDLVQEIARKMPGVDFHCWGDALLDSPPDFRRSPRNLILNPGFKDYAELPFDEADLWLFTSAWEGMPTILIEIAMRGMSVVASQVGGVPELVNDETGFAVHDIEDVSAYVAVIQLALDHPELRVERARKLQKRAATRYSQRNYVRQLKDVLAREE